MRLLSNHLPVMLTNWKTPCWLPVQQRSDLADASFRCNGLDFVDVCKRGGKIPPSWSQKQVTQGNKLFQLRLSHSACYDGVRVIKRSRRRHRPATFLAVVAALSANCANFAFKVNRRRKQNWSVSSHVPVLLRRLSSYKLDKQQPNFLEECSRQWESQGG